MCNSSTKMLHERLVEEQPAPRLSNSSIWQKFHFTYNLLNSFINTEYTCATLITGMLSLEPLFWEMSLGGIIGAIPLAVFFSLCESHSHDAEDSHFNHTMNSTEPDLERGEQDTPQAPLTWKQTFLASGHFLSDVIEGVGLPLFVSKRAGIDGLSMVHRGLIYSGMGLYSLLGNTQELKNTVTAFKEENGRTLSRAPSSIAMNRL